MKRYRAPVMRPEIERMEDKNAPSAGLSAATLGAMPHSAQVQIEASSRRIQVFQVRLRGSEETPPNDSRGTGQATLRLSRDGQTLSFVPSNHDAVVQKQLTSPPRADTHTAV